MRALILVGLLSACAHRPDPLRIYAKLGGACRKLHVHAAQFDPETVQAAADAIDEAPDKRARCREILDDWRASHHRDDDENTDEGD